MKAILVIGGCGSGKTWVMLQLIQKLKCIQLGKIGLFYYHRSDKHTILGKYGGGTFQGSDALSMGVMADAERFKKECVSLIVIAEGDRFTCARFIELFKPKIIRILDTGEKGRALRGSNQTERQIKSKATQVSNVAKANEVIDVKNSTEALAMVLKLIR